MQETRLLRQRQFGGAEAERLLLFAHRDFHRLGHGEMLRSALPFVTQSVRLQLGLKLASTPPDTRVGAGWSM